MKMLLTTVAISAALAFPVLAEGTIGSEEAQGEASGSFRATAQQEEPLILASAGERAMAQAPAPQQKAKGADKAKGEAKAKPDTYAGFSVDSLKSPTGMDGGNRK
jgi:hypothetical protein